MQPDEATFLLSVLLPLIENEHAITKKVLTAVPENHRDYRLDNRSRTAMELAWHIASSDIHFLGGVIHGQFSLEDPKMPAQMHTVADIFAWYKKKMPELIERLKSMSGDELARPIVAGPFNSPAVTYLNMMITHAVHHRGWLCAYLRPMGAKVPSIYGGSMDEPLAI